MATKSTSAQDESEASVTYKVLRQQLDEVLIKLQDPDCDVDEAVSLYEQALLLAGKLESRLDAAENRVQDIQAAFGVAGNGK